MGFEFSDMNNSSNDSEMNILYNQINTINIKNELEPNLEIISIQFENFLRMN